MGLEFGAKRPLAAMSPPLQTNIRTMVKDNFSTPDKFNRKALPLKTILGYAEIIVVWTREGARTMARLTEFEATDIDGNPITNVTVVNLAPAIIVMLRGLF